MYFFFIIIIIFFEKVVLSQNGLLTTVAYKLGPDQPTVYALEVNTKENLMNGMYMYKNMETAYFNTNIIQLIK